VWRQRTCERCMKGGQAACDVGTEMHPERTTFTLE
jgi:hypothetical protein